MSVKAEVLNALRWSAAGRVVGQLGSWAITIYVIRILDPADYGLMGMASILMPFAALLNELGMIPALIQSPRVDEQLIRQLFGFVITSTVLIFCVLFLAAPALAAFFNEPRLTPITRVLAAAMVVGGVSAVPNALLERELQFRGISLVEFSSMIVGSLATLALAIEAFGVWSLVIGQVVATVAKTIGILVVSRFRLTPLFGWSRLRSFVTFGANITGQRVLWHAYSSTDVLLIGKLLGDHALGVYSVAFQLATLPVSKVFGIVNRVAFPAYARLQHDNRQAAEYFIASVKLTWFAFCPILWGLSSVSDEFVEVFMGHNWEEAGVVLALVPLIVPFRVILFLIAPLMDGLGRPDLGLRNLLTSTALIPPAILIGTLKGLTGVCTALIIASIVGLAINCRRSLGLLELSPGALVRAVAPTAIGGGVMYVCVWLVRTLIFADASAPWRLSGAIITGMTVYALMTFFINRDAIRQCMTLLRRQALPLLWKPVSDNSQPCGEPEMSLDPDDWESFRAAAHIALDDAIEFLRTVRQRPVWQPAPELVRIALDAPVSTAGQDFDSVYQEFKDLILPYSTGNTHPRFFGWVHGTGQAGGIVAEMLAAAMNANCGGRDHVGIHVERVVLGWCKELFGFPAQASGLLVSGTSMANLIALTVARNARDLRRIRAKGVGGHPRLVAYASTEVHECVIKAMEILGLGGDHLRRIPTDEWFRIDLRALQDRIADDRSCGFEPFCVIGTAGTVNTGAIDDLDALATFCTAEKIWFHIDGAFGALCVLSEELRPLVSGIERANSIAFDFHKWLHVPYDAGCILVRDGDLHRSAFSNAPGLSRQPSARPGGR